jgi:hypothetical protein
MITVLQQSSVILFYDHLFRVTFRVRWTQYIACETYICITY